MFEFPNDDQEGDLPLDGFNIVGAYPHGLEIASPTLYAADGLEIRGSVIYDADFEEWVLVMETGGDSPIVAGGSEDGYETSSLFLAQLNLRRLMTGILNAYNRKLRDDGYGAGVPINLN